MRVWVWVGHLWTERVQLVLEHYGDRITDVSIFGWHVDATGKLTQTFNPDLLLPYRAKWPHLRFWLAFRNDGDPNIAAALLASATARGRLIDGLRTALDARPWLHGIDIDLERVGGASNAVPAENLFRQIASLAHARGKECSAALPPLTASGSVGGEDWARYSVLGSILDHCAIMSYDFAWAGSAPGPVSPGFWMQQVYDWAVSQIPRSKLMMGIPLYSYFWRLHNYPANEGRTYRGDSGTFYAAWQYFTGYRAWDGSEANPLGSGSHDRIGWLAFRDPDSWSAWGFLSVYDWRHSPDYDAGSASGIISDTYDGRPYTVRYGRPSGDPLWSVANNANPNAKADYTLTPRRVRAIDGQLVSPKNGYTLTVEVLKRHPVAATIIDDNAGTDGQLEAIYDVASGSWSRWVGSSYWQYRGSGQLNFAHDFGSQALYMQIRAQFAGSGWVGVTARGITAEVHPSGELRVRQGGTILATGSVSSRPVGAAPGSGMFVLGLRVREGSARAYFGLTEARELTRIVNVPVAPLNGIAGIVAEAAAWIDHVYLGDGWWYQPREAVEVQIGASTLVLGRPNRVGILWDYTRNMFRPTADVDEPEMRTTGFSLDWVYEHWRAAPLSTDRSARVRVFARDHDVWVGRILAVDSNGASIAYWSDAETVVHWRDRAHFDWGLDGIAMWTLGQEDVRTWERLARGELPPETKRTNA